MESLYGKIHVKIKGKTPLLMNRMDMESLKSKTTKRTKTYDLEKDARRSAYITEVNGKEQLYIPSVAIYTMIINTSKLYKQKGRRSSIAYLLAGTIRIEPEKILLGHCNYEVDVRPVVIQRARIPRARAKIPEWEATFTLIYDKTVITESIVATLKEIISDAGRRMGLLDYRPQKMGWFGTFIVEEFNIE